ncbi:MAG: hypothetical protein FJZ01_10515 [Candidatus Sericytochromatia bacterium]|nr:hypothetical protein [Candidatus Tanganyikabacteria bacterium]
MDPFGFPGFNRRAAVGLFLVAAAGCSLLPLPGFQERRTAPSIAGEARTMDLSVEVSVDVPGVDRLTQYGGPGSLHSDINMLIVGLFDYGSTTAPSLGYLYSGAAGSFPAAQVLDADGAPYLTTGTGAIKNLVGTANCSGCDFSAIADKHRRYVLRNYGTGAGFTANSTTAKFTNIPLADAAGLHRYVVFALAYNAGTPTAELLGYTEARVDDGVAQPATESADVPMTGTMKLDLKLNRGLLNPDKALTQGPTLSAVVPGARSPLQDVATVAGNGSAGMVNATGTAARFASPFGITTDAAGNLYVADYTNHRIRKVTAGGVVTTLAGGTAGLLDGSGGAARFKYPNGVAADANGNVYVADTDNHAIRKITPAGVVSTLAGTGAEGYVDSAGGTPRFAYPRSVAVDASGNVYVSDYQNGAIRKITSVGVVTTLAGDGTDGYVDGTGAGARFSQPSGLDVDAAGNLYVADSLNHRIRKITAGGVVTTIAGSGTAGFADGPASMSQST